MLLNIKQLLVLNYKISQWLSNFNVQPESLEGQVKQTEGPTLGTYNSRGLAGLRICISNRFPGMWVLLAQSCHFQNH